MIVWGGNEPGGYANTGGVYDPVTDTWTATSTTSAPLGRGDDTAVWTGSRMIVWGGYISSGGGSFLDTGGIYDPATDTWTATSTTGAPGARGWHTAVWTGSRMIVWGGCCSGPWEYYYKPWIYDPPSGTWTAGSTTGAPVARAAHTATWTGSKMIVWGGQVVGDYTNTGGIYDPAMDTWTAMTTTGAPTARVDHTALWTGSKMIVWGGRELAGDVNTGAIYDPATDTWAAMTTTGAPSPRQTAVWTGSRMIVWGSDGGTTHWIYDPAADTWTARSATGAPSSRQGQTAVWTRSKMIVWGGSESSGLVNTGGILDDPAAYTQGGFFSVIPCRLADTRSPVGPSGGPALQGNATRTFVAAGTCGIPSTAAAVAINVTVVNETDHGNLRLYPAGGGMPGSSTINFTAHKVRANNAVIQLGVDGQIAVRCDMPPGSTGQTDFLFDATGYFE